MKKMAMVLLLLLFCALLLPCVSAAALGPGSDRIYDGIDVSVFQGDIDFSQVKAAGIEAVYIRAGEGDTITDPNFEQNYSRARAADLRYGFYYFVTARDAAAAQAQADRFAGLLAGKTYTMRPAMDFESFDGMNRAQILLVASTFLERLEQRTGILPVLYSDAYNTETLWSSAFGRYPLWVAEYNDGQSPPDNPVWRSWAGYQFSDAGRVDGIDATVDLDKFAEPIFVTGTTPENPDEPSEPETVDYTVRRGDTLTAIARRFGTTVTVIADANGIRNPNLIFAGEVLRIPLRGTPVAPQRYFNYTVRRGDTLSAIARRYGTTVNALVAANDIRNPNLIFTGEILRIPR